MTSEPPVRAEQAWVWVWLPGATAPVLAGRLDRSEQRYTFTYGRSYRERSDAIALSPFELPLRPGAFEPEGLHAVHSCLRDAAPDAWGRRVIGYRHPGFQADELDFMLLSGSDRIGALDFQRGGVEWNPRGEGRVRLEDLSEAAALIDARRPLPPELDLVLLHGSSVGGARPKAVVDADDAHYIAKFSSSTDTYDVVKAEFVAMRLAALVGLDVARVELKEVLGRDVLLVTRFDRLQTARGTTRRLLLSGLSLLGLHEMEARYASYRALADLIRQRFDAPGQTLRELFRRLVFNILVGNTDDHARNHSAFWDGRSLQLTPAYDVCPQLRSGGEASQAMGIGGVRGNLATLANAVSIADAFQVETKAARDIADDLLSGVRAHWDAVCDEARLGQGERKRLWGTAVVNPFCLEGW